MRQKTIFILTGLVVIRLTARLFLASQSYGSFNPRKFNPEEWKIEKENRVELVDHLIHSKILDSLALTELIHVLGKPEKEPVHFKENDNLV